MIDDKDILSIDSDDDNKDYMAFSEHLENHTKRRKNHILHDIEENGERYLNEIERKKSRKDLKKTKYISYILNHCDGRHDEDELLSYSFEDVFEIYEEIREDRKPFIVKFFRFVFNL